MAREITCDFCQQESGVVMITELSDGTVVAVGPACMPHFIGVLVQRFIPQALIEAETESDNVESQPDSENAEPIVCPNCGSANIDASVSDGKIIGIACNECETLTKF